MAILILNLYKHFHPFQTMSVCLTSERRKKRKETTRRPTVSDDKIQEAPADCYICIYMYILAN